MDPNACLERWRNAVASGDRREAREARSDLKEWCYRGGFEPNWAHLGERLEVLGYGFRVNSNYEKVSGEMNHIDVVRAVKEASEASFKPTPACGCGRAYVCLSSKNDRRVVNSAAKAAKLLGLTFLRKAYGTAGNAFYMGYDNADGRSLGRAHAFAKILNEKGIDCYVDAVAD